ncbi:hypothetical protein ACLOJK_039828 [Asimina triloba]
MIWMGRHFVPNLTIGAPVIESLRKHTKYVFVHTLLPGISIWAYLDCHLMVTNPLDYVETLGKAGASGFTFHVEASKGMFSYNWKEVIQSIRAKGMRPGVALKPGTSIEEVYPLNLPIDVGRVEKKLEERERILLRGVEGKKEEEIKRIRDWRIEEKSKEKEGRSKEEEMTNRERI